MPYPILILTPVEIFSFITGRRWNFIQVDWIFKTKFNYTVKFKNILECHRPTFIYLELYVISLSYVHTYIFRVFSNQSFRVLFPYFLQTDTLRSMTLLVIVEIFLRFSRKVTEENVLILWSWKNEEIKFCKITFKVDLFVSVILKEKIILHLLRPNS